MDNLQNGIAAFRAGKHDEARKHFIAAMRENPQNENVWGWLYQVSKNDSERIECLNKILAINPNNSKARERLDQLRPPAVQAAQVPQQKQSSNPPASTTPAPKKPDPLQQRNTLVGIGVIVLLCFICFLAFSSYDPPSEPKNHATMAYIICQLYIENMLKAPSTADFPSSSSTNIRNLGNNVFEMYSYVDAQNSFGAMMRTNWYCKIQYLGTEEDEDGDPKFWDLLDIKIIE